VHFFVEEPGEVDTYKLSMIVNLLGQTREIVRISIRDHTSKESGQTWDMAPFTSLVDNSPKLVNIGVVVHNAVNMDNFVARVASIRLFVGLWFTFPGMTIHHVDTLLAGFAEMTDLRTFVLSGLKSWTTELFEKLCAVLPRLTNLRRMEIAHTSMENVLHGLDPLTHVLRRRDFPNLESIVFSDVLNILPSSIEKLGDLLKKESPKYTICISNDAM
jgi:hypothetical protein